MLKSVKIIPAILAIILLLVFFIGLLIMMDKIKLNKNDSDQGQQVSQPVSEELFTKVSDQKIKNLNIIFERGNNVYLKRNDNKEEFLFSMSVGGVSIQDLILNQDLDSIIYRLDNKIQKFDLSTKKITTVVDNIQDKQVVSGLSLDGKNFSTSRLLDSGQCELNIVSIAMLAQKTINYDPIVVNRDAGQWRSCHNPSYITKDGSLISIASGEGPDSSLIDVSKDKLKAELVPSFDIMSPFGGISSNIDKIVSSNNADFVLNLANKIYDQKQGQYLLSLSGDNTQALIASRCNQEESCPNAINNLVSLWKMDLSTGIKTPLNSFKDWSGNESFIYTKTNTSDEKISLDIYVNDSLIYKTNEYISIIKSFGK